MRIYIFLLLLTGWDKSKPAYFCNNCVMPTNLHNFWHIHTLGNLQYVFVIINGTSMSKVEIKILQGSAVMQTVLMG